MGAFTYVLFISVIYSVQGILEVAVNNIKQTNFGHFIQVPYDATVNLKCSASAIEFLTFVNTTLDLDSNLTTGLSPYVFISANFTIDHFERNNRGFYSCISNVSAATPDKILVTSDIYELNITDFVRKQVGSSTYTTILAKYAAVPEQLLQWYVNGKPIGHNTIFDVNFDGLNTYLKVRHTTNQTFGTFMLKVNGTSLMDSIRIPQSQTSSGILDQAKSLLTKVMQLLGIKTTSSQKDLVSGMESNKISVIRPRGALSHSMSDSVIASSQQPIVHDPISPTATATGNDNSTTTNLRDKILKVITSLKQIVLNSPNMLTPFSDNRKFDTSDQPVTANRYNLTNDVLTTSSSTIASRPQYDINKDFDTNHQSATTNSYKLPTPSPTKFQYSPYTAQATTTKYIVPNKHSLSTNQIIQSSINQVLLDTDRTNKIRSLKKTAPTSHVSAPSTTINKPVWTQPNKVIEGSKSLSSTEEHSSIINLNKPSPSVTSTPTSEQSKHKTKSTDSQQVLRQSQFHQFTSDEKHIVHQHDSKLEIANKEQMQYALPSEPVTHKYPDTSENTSPEFTFGGFYVTAVKGLIEFAPKIPDIINQGVQYLKQQFSDVGDHFKRGLNFANKIKLSPKKHSPVNLQFRTDKLSGGANHLKHEQSHNSDISNINAPKIQNRINRYHIPTSQVPHSHAQAGHENSEEKEINERGQIVEPAQPASTSSSISTPMVVAVTITITGVLLFIAGLVMILVYYLVFRKKNKISQTDLESANDSNTSLDTSSFSCATDEDSSESKGKKLVSKATKLITPCQKEVFRHTRPQIYMFWTRGDTSRKTVLKRQPNVGKKNCRHGSTMPHMSIQNNGRSCKIALRCMHPSPLPATTMESAFDLASSSILGKRKCHQITNLSIVRQPETKKNKTATPKTATPAWC